MGGSLQAFTVQSTGCTTTNIESSKLFVPSCPVTSPQILHWRGRPQHFRNLTVTRHRGTHNRAPLFLFNWSVVACGVCCDDTAVSCLLNLCCFSSLFTAQCQQRQPSLHIYSISSNVFFSISEDFCVSSKKSYISSL